MPQLTLAQAQTIITTALKHGTDQKMQPLAVVVLDERGVPKAYAAQDGTSLRRYEIASGKAHGALSFGIGSRALAKRAAANPHFIAAVTHAVGGSLVPVPVRNMAWMPSGDMTTLMCSACTPRVTRFPDGCTGTGSGVSILLRTGTLCRLTTIPITRGSRRQGKPLSRNPEP